MTFHSWVRSLMEQTNRQTAVHNAASYREGLIASNEMQVRRRTNQLPVTATITARWLHLFGHIARANPSQDQSHALQVAINHPSAECRHQTGRPRRTWLHTVKLDVRQCNIGLHSVWQCVLDWSKWQKVVETAIFLEGHSTSWWCWWCLVT